MNYVAVNTKIRAMRATLLSARDYFDLLTAGGGTDYYIDLQEDFAKISPYLSKNTREFAAKIGEGILTPAVVDKSDFDKSSRESLKRVFGVETDLRNILWIYRLKKYHKIEGDAIYSFLTPENYRLCSQEIAAYSHAKDMESFAQAVKTSVYGTAFKSLHDFTRGEQILTQAVRKQFKKESRFENLAVVCGYLYERRLEIKNLNAISLGLTSGLTPEEILGLLHL